MLQVVMRPATGIQVQSEMSRPRLMFYNLTTSNPFVSRRRCFCRGNLILRCRFLRDASVLLDTETAGKQIIGDGNAHQYCRPDHAERRQLAYLTVFP
jgi:hypothetical protein